MLFPLPSSPTFDIKGETYLGVILRGFCQGRVSGRGEMSGQHRLNVSLHCSAMFVVDPVIISTGSVCTKTRVSAIICLRIGWMETRHLIVKIRGSMSLHTAFDISTTDRSGIGPALGHFVTFAKRPSVCRSLLRVSTSLRCIDVISSPIAVDCSIMTDIIY